jgi:hypothetical protein
MPPHKKFPPPGESQALTMTFSQMTTSPWPPAAEVGLTQSV